MEAALKCRNCGYELPPNAKFCLECGTPTGAPKCEKSAYVFRNRGEAYEEKGDSSNAHADFIDAVVSLADFRKAVRLDPDNEKYRESLENLERRAWE